MSPFTGFPPRASFVPVPAPIFGPLLEEIQDLAELQCAMRLIYLLHRQQGPLKFVPISALSADSTLLRALRHVEPSERPGHALRRALEACIARSLFLRAPVQGEQGPDELLLLNTPANQRAVGLGWVPAEMAEDGNIIDIRVQGQAAKARVQQAAFYDPEGARLRM